MEYEHVDASSLFKALRAVDIPIRGYDKAAEFIGRDEKSSRYVGQVVSRIDYACFISGLPMISIHRVRKPDGSINLDSLGGAEWKRWADEIQATTVAHQWTQEELDTVERAIHNLPEHSARLLWADVGTWDEKKIRWNLHRKVLPGTLA